MQSVNHDMMVDRRGWNIEPSELCHIGRAANEPAMGCENVQYKMFSSRLTKSPKGSAAHLRCPQHSWASITARAEACKP